LPEPKHPAGGLIENIPFAKRLSGFVLLLLRVLVLMLVIEAPSHPDLFLAMSLLMVAD
jgi:hypothetical protein